MKTKDENNAANEKTENKLKEREEKTDQMQLEAPEGKAILTLNIKFLVISLKSWERKYG